MTILLTSLLLSSLALLLSSLWGKKNPGQSSSFTAGMILLLVFLPITAALPKLETSALPAEYFPAVNASPQISIFDILLIVWALGTVLLLARLLTHYIAVHRWRRDAQRCSSPEWTSRLHACCSKLEMDTIPSLALSDSISSPVVTGLIYPQILLPKSSEQWPEDTINYVLLHELGHVKRKDLWVSVASHLACAIYWFNPFVWKLRKSQMTQCEFACDAFVLSSGANAKNYINAICNVAETAAEEQHVALALAMANKASLRRRVEVLLKEPKTNGHTLTLVTLFLTATAAFAANTIIPSRPQPKPDTAENLLIEDQKIRLEANPFPAD